MSFMGKVEDKSTFRAVQGFSCPVFDKLNELFSAVALRTIRNPIGRKANILFNHQAEAGAFTVKRLSGFLPRVFLLFGLALLFLAHPVFASESDQLGNEIPHVLADDVSDDKPGKEAHDGRDRIFVKNELQEVEDPFHDYLYVFLLFSIIGFIVGIVACGIHTLTMSDEKFKAYHDKLYNRSDWNMCQRIVLLWFFLQMLFAFHLHGKPCSYTTHNMYYELAYSTVCLAILYFGGFWKCKQKALKGEEND